MKIPPSQITPERMYRRRRELMLGIAGLAAGAAMPAAAGPAVVMPVRLIERLAYSRNARYSTAEATTAFADAKSYNNF